MSIPSFQSAITFRLATVGDVLAIVALVNSAYRGESSRAGWTTEADILGGQRTDAEEITQLVVRSDSAMLLCLHDVEIIGSVHVAIDECATAYMGMLVIKPVLQGQGLGKRFMHVAERFVSEEWGASRVRIWVVTLRHELIAFYQRRGYVRTGVVKPFPATDPKFGLPKVNDLQFEVMEKTLCIESAQN